MKHLTQRTAIAVVLAAGLTACGDPVGTDDPIGLAEPVLSATEVTALARAFDGPVATGLAESSALFMAMPGAPAASATLAVAGLELALARSPGDLEAAATRLVERGPDVAPPLVLIPHEFRGRVYDFDRATGQYYHDPDRQGPAHGVRFIMYDFHAGTDRADVIEIGHVDLLDESTAQSRVVRLITVTGGAEHINYTVAQTVLGDAHLRYEIAGFFGNDVVDTFTFDLAMDVVADELATTATLDYYFDAPAHDFRMTAHVVLTKPADGAAPTADFDVLLQQSAAAVQLLGRVEADTGTFEVFIDGGFFAWVTFTPDTLTVIGADGSDLTAQYGEAARALFDAVEEIVVGRWLDFLLPVAFLFA